MYVKQLVSRRALSLNVFHLAAEQQQFVDSVHEFARKEIAPLAADIDKHNDFPKHLWRKLGDMGLLGVTVSPDFHGLGLGYLEHVLAMEAISRASGSVGLSYGAHSNLCVNQIHRNGTAQQKAQFLPKLVSGEHVGALAMSETGSGSDVLSMQLRAEERDDHYLLNGGKMWITNGPDADIIIVYAKTAPERGAKGITAFIVDAKTSGVQCAPKLDKLGMRGSNTCELVFADARVCKQSGVLGRVNEGSRVLMSGLDYERLVLAGGPLGLMQAAMDVALPYVHERKQFNEPVGTFQLTQGKLADMYCRMLASRAMVYSTASSVDRQGSEGGGSGGSGGGSDASRAAQCAAAILYAAEDATRMALDAIQCLGGNGYINEYPCGRLLRDAKLYEIGAGTSEIRRMVIGRAINKFYL